MKLNKDVDEGEVSPVISWLHLDTSHPSGNMLFKRLVVKKFLFEKNKA